MGKKGAECSAHGVGEKRVADLSGNLKGRYDLEDGASTLTLRRPMSYIYIYMEHPFLMFLDHTQRRSTVGRTLLDE